MQCYVELVIVKIEVKYWYDDIFEIILEVFELLELLIDFRHLFKKKASDVIFILHLCD